MLEIYDGSFITTGSSSHRILAVHLDGFVQRYAKCLEKFLSAPLLAIHSRDFLNPAEPPAAVLFYNRRILVHLTNLSVFPTPLLWIVASLRPFSNLLHIKGERASGVVLQEAAP